MKEWKYKEDNFKNNLLDMRTYYLIITIICCVLAFFVPYLAIGIIIGSIIGTVKTYFRYKKAEERLKNEK